MSPKAAGDINLQNGNLLLLSGNVLVQVDRKGDVIDGTFLPFSAFDVGLDVNGRMLIAATDFFHPPNPPIIYRVDRNGMILNSNLPPVQLDRFAVTPQGDFLLGEGTTIFRVDSEFGFLDAFPVLPSPGSAPQINGISVDQEGNIFVAAYSFNGRSSVIYKMDDEGSVLETFGPYPFQIQGLTVDTNAHIFYARATNDMAGFPLPSVVVELDANGLEMQTFQTPFQVDSITLINVTPPPRLFVDCTAGNELGLRWATNAIGFQLQAASTSLLHNWSNVIDCPTIVDGFFTITLRADQPGMIFRLLKSP